MFRVRVKQQNPTIFPYTGEMPPNLDALAPFDASSSAIGYAYQLRIALARALELKGSGIDWTVCVEGRDDVESTTPDGSILEQHKQHEASGTLGDQDVDLWKTLRIWSTGVAGKVIDTESTHLLFVTTARVNPGTAAAHLQAENRNPGAALGLLESAAKKTKNKSLEKAITAWDKLEMREKELLLRQVRVISSAPNIDTVRQTLEKLAGYAVKDSHRSSFIDYLEGWWFNRCIQSLRAADPVPISGEEFDAHYHRIKERFIEDSLPVYDDIKTHNVYDIGEFVSHCFVRQLKLSEIGSARILHAIRDYLRAGAQRSSWIRQKLLLPQQIDSYEQDLVEAWEIVFDREVDTIGEDATLEKKKAAAAAIYRWVEDAVAPPLRAGIPEAFLTRGSLHILSDDGRVGWHPNYRDLLHDALEPLVQA
jgi:hypothetical protein